MALIATDTYRLSNWLKSEYAPELAFCRAVVTVNDSAQTLATGTVLGKVTATGKYKVCVQTASDGSQTADAIVMDAVTIPATTDTKVLVLLRGPATVGKNIVLHASHDLDAEKLAIYTALEAKNIQVLDVV